MDNTKSQAERSVQQNKRYFVGTFIVLGIVFLFLSYLINLYFDSDFFNNPLKGDKEGGVKARVARVERESGKIWILRSWLEKLEPVEKKSTVYALDSIETQDVGEAVITFDSSFVVRLLDNTLVTIEQEESPETGSYTILILKKGDLKIEKYGKEGSLLIAKNGERISAFDYMNSPLAKAEPLPTVDGKTAEGKISNDLDKKNESTLSEEEISTEIAKQKHSFFKCYSVHLLQKDPKIKPEVTLSFTIENSGKVSFVEVTSPRLNNKEFEGCIREILLRTAFRTFSGNPISPLIPLKFD